MNKRFFTLLLCLLLCLAMTPAALAEDLTEAEAVSAEEAGEPEEAAESVEDAVEPEEVGETEVSVRIEYTAETAEKAMPSGTCGSRTSWSLSSDGRLTIWGSGEIERPPIGDYTYFHALEYYVKTIVINRGVTGICDNAFKGITDLTNVAIPDTVAKIGKNAFSGCTKLTEVTIPKKVTVIEEGCFNNCTSLTRANIPDTVTTIGKNAFFSCSELRSVSIPASVTEIGETAFYGAGLETVTLPESVRTLGKGAFSHCFRLTEATIPGSVGSVTEDAFRYSRALERVKLGEGIIAIGPYAFAECEKLSQITWPKSLRTIGERGFYYCISLKDVTLPEGVERLEKEAFFRCEAMETLQLPCSLLTIGQSCFDYCEALKSARISEGTVSIGARAFQFCKNLESLIIPASVTEVGEQAFFRTKLLTAGPIGSGCNLEFGWTDTIPARAFAETPLQTVRLPEGLTEISKELFQNSTSLKSVWIPSSVTLIGESAFSECYSLAEISLPEGLARIGKKAFYQCGTWEDNGAVVSLPNSVKVIEEQAFFMSKIGHIEIKDLEAWLKIEAPSGSTARPQGQLYINGEPLRDAVIPKTITRIPDAAFYGCSGLRSITIPTTVEKIGNYAFAYCNSVEAVYIDDLGWWLTLDAQSRPAGQLYVKGQLLERAVIPNSVTAIPNNVFQNCTGLREVILPDSVTTLGSYSFQNCTGLTAITLPDSVTVMGQDCFSGCTGLKTAVLSPNLKEVPYRAFLNCESLTELTIPYGVTTLSDCAFSGCASLKRADLPKSVNRIGSEAFYNCKCLEEVKLPEGIPEIPMNAFRNSESLKSIVIPASVTKIGGRAFDCSGVQTIRFLGEMPNLGTDCFVGVTATAYYPENKGWEEKLNGYMEHRGNLTWIPYSLEEGVNEEPAVEVHYNVSVKDSFDVKIGVIVHDGYDPAKCTVQIGETGTPTPVTGRTHVAVIGSFPAKNLGDRLYICVRYEGEIVQEEYYSVKKYCEDMIAAGKNAELCQAVLDYGSYAQQYFKYNTAELANGGEFKTAQSTVPESENEKTDKNSGISDAKLNLSLESNLSMKAAFLPKDSDSLNGCRITVDGEQVTPEITSMGYIIKFGFKPAQVTKTFEIVVTTATGSYIFKVTPLAYLYSMSQKGDADLTNLCQALYTFAKTI